MISLLASPRLGLVVLRGSLCGGALTLEELRQMATPEFREKLLQLSAQFDPSSSDEPCPETQPTGGPE
jgi:hypothetical protein